MGSELEHLKCLHEEDWGKYKNQVDINTRDIVELKEDIDGNAGLKTQVTELMTLSKEGMRRTTLMIAIITLILMGLNIYFGIKNKPIPPQTIIIRGQQRDTVSSGNPYYGPVTRDWNVYESKINKNEKKIKPLLGIQFGH